MTQWRVLCPHNHLLKTAATAGDIRELSSPRVDQSASWRIRELSSYRESLGVEADHEMQESRPLPVAYETLISATYVVLWGLLSVYYSG